ncbi:16S rRNA (cytosine967-C5)-methyltransferase [Amycolatopsis arida]|uniref:16S rRNA (Cytosine967-C5)-methyltransferase n=1 Tax=Amycolatopsis arida TaxID=587909 RepID=A0A1I5Z488_9PSEU|nr:transcription antitermination factor NusB [Amycolatopsis arida]TDX90095.1 16S rRNA (cytosine967-C5)-methyltransferase [Amycolatopsis arida]SFQ50937.1 16S rRNA (cytosine967-C5)-methyltransferase [Amycolatopsis arida]
MNRERRDRPRNRPAPRREYAGRREHAPRRPVPTDPARRAALDVLHAIRERDAYANLVLPELLRERRITGRDAALATELTYGAARAQGLLDAIIAACLDRPLDKVDGAVLDGLRLGAYQLLRTRIPEHAAVTSTVDLVRADAGSHVAGFVNAVLRSVSAKDEETWLAELAPDPTEDPIGSLALRTAHPRWIARAFAEALGDTGAELAAALRADDERPAVHLVARPGEISAEELAAITGGEVAPYSPYGVHLPPSGGDLADSEPIRERLAAVQDEGSQLCALAALAAPAEGPDHRWLDLCAGPGGKAALWGALAASTGATVDAVEKAPHRARLVERAIEGLPVTVHVADGRESGLPGGYDRVLVDAPCTGLGALRRRPEARWRRRPSDVAELTRLQSELLAAAFALLRPGGVLAYVVCSPHLAETEGVVAAAARRARAATLDARELFPGVPQLGDGPYVQLWPHRHGTDAMFCAVLRAPE